jgi:hypothetical protein
MVDPELKYCLQCNDEYMPQIEKCGVCGMKLISGREMLEREEVRTRNLAKRAGRITPDDDLVGIRQGALSDMKNTENLLNSERIATLLVGDESSCGKGCGCASSFVLQVRREDAQDALAILADEFRRSTGLDQHDISNADNVFDPLATEVVCPACGHSFSPTAGACTDCGLQF